MSNPHSLAFIPVINQRQKKQKTNKKTPELKAMQPVWQNTEVCCTWALTPMSLPTILHTVNLDQRPSLHSLSLYQSSSQWLLQSVYRVQFNYKSTLYRYEEAYQTNWKVIISATRGQIEIVVIYTSQITVIQLFKTFNN